MIIFDLQCMDCGQNFEGWFESHQAFMEQKQQNLLSCPICDANNIEKKLSIPAVSKKANQSENIATKTPLSPEEVRMIIKDFRRHVTNNFENVGDKFTEESRKIHYGESEERGIYGKASIKDIRELNDEGIDILPLPDLPKDN